MIRYLIDANVVSELRKPKPYRAAVAWLQNLELGQGFFSAVTFGEIQKGVELTRRQDPVKANEIEAWAAQLERTSEIFPMDAACFREYARLRYRRSDTLAIPEVSLERRPRRNARNRVLVPSGHRGEAVITRNRLWAAIMASFHLGAPQRSAGAPSHW